jgi:hypothetical protein
MDKPMPDAPPGAAAPAAAAAAPPTAVVEKKSALPKKHKVADTRPKDVQATECISRVSQYRAGGDGGKALKLLGVFVKNVVDNPGEPKYRGISLESNAYKSKVREGGGERSQHKEEVR